MKFDGYHVTPTSNVKGILNSYNNFIPIDTGIKYMTKQLSLKGGKTNRKIPGSLGYGLYTFTEGLLAPEALIDGFAKRVTGNVQLKKVIFHINVEESNILDLTSSSSIQYQSFANYCEATAKAINKINFQFTSKGKNQLVWEGVATELFIGEMEKRGKIYYGVRRDTYTPLFRNSVDASIRKTSNGIEFLIRDWSIVSTIEHDVLKLSQEE